MLHHSHMTVYRAKRKFAITNLESDGGGVNVVHVETIAELLNPGGDLVEVDWLLPPVPLQHEDAARLLLHHPDLLLRVAA